MANDDNKMENYKHEKSVSSNSDMLKNLKDIKNGQKKQDLSRNNSDDFDRTEILARAQALRQSYEKANHESNIKHVASKDDSERVVKNSSDRQETAKKDPLAKQKDKKESQQTPLQRNKDNNTRGTSKEDEISLKNKKLLEEAKQNSLKNKKKKDRKKWSILLVILLLFLLITGGVLYFYFGFLNKTNDGSVRISIKLDESSWYDWTASGYVNKKIFPGDTIQPVVKIRNSYSSTGDEDNNWETTIVRFRTYLIVDGKIIDNGLSIKTGESFMTFDAQKEQELGSEILESDGWFYCEKLFKPNDELDLIKSITFNGEAITNELAGKDADVLFEVQALPSSYIKHVIDRKLVSMNDRGKLEVSETYNVDKHWSKAPQAWIEKLREFNV